MEQCKHYLGNSSKRLSGVERLQPKAFPHVGNQFRATPGAKSAIVPLSDHPPRSTTPRSTFFADNQRYVASGGFKPGFTKYSTAYDRQNLENCHLDLSNNPLRRDCFETSVIRPPPGYMPITSAGSSHSSTQQSQFPPAYDRRTSTELPGLSNQSDTFGLGSFQVGGGTSGVDNFPSFNYSSFYEPPKPDTPPTRAMPFGFDPVWSNNVTGTYEPGQGFGAANGNNMHSVRPLFIYAILK